jgi:hypothetical protein
MGTEQATAYQSQASAALSTLLSAVQQGKTQLDAAQGAITGQATSVPGEDPGGDMGMDAGNMPPVDDGDMADIDVDADVEVDDTKDLAAALGRERRK